MLNLIVAYAKNRVIGRGGDIPWSLPDDSQYFMRMTSGHIVVMGRGTFDSIGRKPLPNRRNIIMTHNSIQQSDIETGLSKEEIIALGRTQEVFISGGEDIYREFLEDAQRLYITVIEVEVEGDTYFPEWRREDFILLSERTGIIDEQNPLPHTFYVYERQGVKEQHA